MNHSNIIMYTTEDGLTKIEATFDEGNRQISRDIDYYNLGCEIKCIGLHTSIQRRRLFISVLMQRKKYGVDLIVNKDDVLPLTDDARKIISGDWY